MKCMEVIAFICFNFLLTNLLEVNTHRTGIEKVLCDQWQPVKLYL